MTETYLVAAISVLAGAVAFLYKWASVNFLACKTREEKCEAKYTRLLEHLAGVAKLTPEEIGKA